MQVGCCVCYLLRIIFIKAKYINAAEEDQIESFSPITSIGGDIAVVLMFCYKFALSQNLNYKNVMKTITDPKYNEMYFYGYCFST